MMIKAITIIAVLILASCSSMNTSEVDKRVLFKSIDWVEQGAFTQGIEGPAVASDGYLYVVNYQQNGTIGRVINSNRVELFVRLPEDSIGNGIRFDSIGNMYIADYVNHNILKISATNIQSEPESSLSVYAHSPLMNQPNDIAITNSDIIFASDPNWAEGKGNLWRIDKEQNITLIESDMGTTNGIAVNPDSTKLYVNESVQRIVWQYQLDSEGNLSNKQQLISFDDYGLDGMRTDTKGNLYIARYGKGVIAIVSPQGKLLREVPLQGMYPTNLAFGGSSKNQIFVTMQKRGAVESFFIN
jgi:sugar lactone lactonase YvrE